MNDVQDDGEIPKQSKFPTKTVVGGGIIALLIAFAFSRRGKGIFGTGGNKFSNDVQKLLAPGNGNPTIDVRVLSRGPGDFLFVKPGDVEGYTIDNLVTITKGKVDGKELKLILRIPGDVLESNVNIIRERLNRENIPFGELVPPT